LDSIRVEEYVRKSSRT